MKPLLLAALVFVPLAAPAQTLDLRAYSGMMMNSGVSNNAVDYDHSKLNAVVGFRASCRVRRLDIGVAVSYRRYSFAKTIIDRGSFNPATGYSGPEIRYQTKIAEPAIAFAPVINYHFGKGRLDWYAGISPAYIRYTVGSPTEGSFSLTKGGQGFSAEAQIGCIYRLLPALSVFAELNGGLIGIQYYRAKNSSFYSSGLNLGAQFRVWESRAKAASAAE